MNINQSVYIRKRKKKPREGRFQRFWKKIKDFLSPNAKKKSANSSTPTVKTRKSLAILTPQMRQTGQKVLFGLSLFLLIQIIFEILLLPFLNIRFIEIDGLSRIPEAQLLSVAGIRGKEYYFSLDERSIQRKIEEIAWVKQAQVFKVFPNRLKIKLEEREPVFLHLMGNAGKQGMVPLLLDDSGIAFVRGEEALLYDLPLLSGVSVQGVELKTQFPLFLRRIFQDMGRLKRLHKPLYDLISEVYVESKWGGGNYDISLYLTNSPILFTLASHLNEDKMTQILLVLDVLRNDKQQGSVASVDLRTNEAVYRYSRE